MRFIIWGSLLLLALSGCSDDDGQANQNNNDNQNTPLPVCGNGQVEGAEECDYGAGNSDTMPNVCRSDCVLPFCGDGVSDDATPFGEACDDGVGNSNTEADACRADCQLPACGDGVIDPNHGEACDDANTDDGDGCSSRCEVEAGWTCQGSPSVCHSLCGDGLVSADEACDDGNLADGDGCSPSCLVEAGFQCNGAPSRCVCVRLVDLDPGITQRDGLAWDTALATVQEGIDSAAASALGCEVWVAAGTYRIYQGDAADTLTLPSGVGVYGGFQGSESTRAERDWQQHRTVLHGADPTETNRVYHVVTASGTLDATLDGFVITGGDAAGSGADGYGGGLYLANASPVIASCTVTGNAATDGGGGLYVVEGSPQISRVVFYGNEGSGGGLYADSASPRIDRCVFAANVGTDGAGLFATWSSIEVTHSIFTANQAIMGGGGYSQWSSAEFSRCVLAGNQAGDSGGGLLFQGGLLEAAVDTLFTGNQAGMGGGLFVWNTEPYLTNCTLVANQAGNGGSLFSYSEAPPPADPTRPSLYNCILWGNGIVDGGIGTLNSEPGLHHCDIQGDTSSVNLGSIDADPGFRTLLNPTGSWTQVSYDDVAMQTVLTDNAASFPVGGLEGRFVQPDNGENLRFPIVSSTATEIRVWGDLTEWVTDTDTYNLHDLQLSASSPCIDRGTVLAPLLPAADFAGTVWADIPGMGTTGAPVDMGAFEYVP